MSAKILDGKRIAQDIEKEIRYSILAHTRHQPRLAIITDGHDPASQVYVKNKIKAAIRCGIYAEVVQLPESQATLTGICEMIRDISRVFDGIILQLPLKNREWENDIISMIPPSKDVDGLSCFNVGALHKNLDYGFEPCTAKGIVTLLRHTATEITGKHAVIVGRSDLVGRPVAELLLQEDATVTICHSKTKNLADVTRTADILVCAVGKPNLIMADMVKPGAIVIDVGINKIDDPVTGKSRLVGDVDFDSVSEVASWITPVPGGVGPMTVAALMANVLKASWN